MPEDRTPEAGPKRHRRLDAIPAVLGVLAILSLAVFAATLYYGSRFSLTEEARAAEHGQVPLAPPETVRMLLDTSLRDVKADEAIRINAERAVEVVQVKPAKPFSIKPNLRATDQFAAAALCLTQAVYYEAAVESGEGQRAVAQVVLNRVRHPAFPKSVCGVVYQGSERATGCQFSFTCDGSLARRPSDAGWARARAVALAALAGWVEPSVGMATHYHANYVLPYWASSLDKVQTIGAHIFYTMPGAIGRPAAFTGRYAFADEALPLDKASAFDAAFASLTPDMAAGAAGGEDAAAAAAAFTPRVREDELVRQSLTADRATAAAGNPGQPRLRADEASGSLVASGSTLIAGGGKLDH